MNAATVASAVVSTMLMAPTIALMVNTRPGVMRSDVPEATSGDEVRVENVELIFVQTSIDPSVRYRIPTAIIQTKNITIATIRLIFSTVHGSTRLSCSDASRGGRRAVFTRRAFSEPGLGGAPTEPLGRPLGAGPTCCGAAMPGPPSGTPGVPAGGVPEPEGVVTTTLRQPDRRSAQQPAVLRPRRRSDRRRRCARWPPGCRPRTGSSAALPWSAAWPYGPPWPGSG